MDEKTLSTLEYSKILERLAGYAAFSASAEKARQLRPAHDLAEALRWQAETTEAVHLLAIHTSLTIGGARDVRELVDLAAHAAVLTPLDLLDVRATLIAARDLSRIFERIGVQYPRLADIAAQIPLPPGLVDAISRAISDRAEVLDSASEKLSTIRHDLRIVHDRLLSRLQRMVSDPKIVPYLQEALVTQRDGRYVLPLRAEFKGRIRSIVHDQSASGATLFVEPLAVVEANNQYRELELAERDEERRILAELSRQVGLHQSEIIHMVDLIAELDLIFSKAKYAQDLDAVEPHLTPFSPSSEAASSTSLHPGSVIRLYNARHPLLDPQTVVPIDLELDPEIYAVVITGPNTGGKTVTLKTAGLLVLMALSGLHIPADSGSELSFFQDVFADIGDEQSIEQSLSTFSGHVTNIIHILDQATPASLVILDELGAGTDPQEGAALARALLTHLLERRITTLVTTHHPELKTFAHATPGVINASVEFDLETLRPTFRLTLGLPGRSNALAIAQRLGMPDPIIQSARSELNPADLRAEDLLDEIYRQRDLSRQSRQAADLARQEAEQLRHTLARQLEQIEDERRQILDKARHDALDQLQSVQEELSQVRRELARSRQPLQVLESAETQIEALEEKLEQPVERRVVQVAGTPQWRPLRLGDKVRLHGLNTQGIVTAIAEDEVEIQVGMLRVRTRPSQLVLASASSIEEDNIQRKPIPPSILASPSTVNPPPSAILPPSPGMELDLRGQRADDALAALDRHLDAAYLAGLPFIRIIHGKGTGRLRQAVREALQEHPHVRSFEGGGEKEGGEGVTIAKLNTG